eukprot:1983025-Prymnesium_polylepis.1
MFNITNPDRIILLPVLRPVPTRARARPGLPVRSSTLKNTTSELPIPPRRTRLRLYKKGRNARPGPNAPEMRNGNRRRVARARVT